MIGISLLFDHRKRAQKGQEGPVEVRVTVNRKAYYINTGVRVIRDRFVAGVVRDVEYSVNDGGEIVGRVTVRSSSDIDAHLTDNVVLSKNGKVLTRKITTDADLLNERLKAVVSAIEREVNTCIEERREINVADIRRKVYDLAPNSEHDVDVPSLLVWIKEQAAVADIASATKKRYTTLTNKLEAYGKITRWEDLTVDAIYQWDVWLRQQVVPLTENQRMAGKNEQTMQASAVYNYHKLLKAMLNRAVKLDVLAANPYDKMKGMFKRGTRDVVDYLTEEQMKKILELTPVPGSQVATARDLFVFQMFTGLSYADTQYFDIREYRQVNGRWEHIGQRIKTGTPYVSQLLPPVVDVLERNGWRVPKMANQRYNQMLKAIGMVIGIPNLHSHMGRHTFATWMLSQGARIENVSRMLGHKDITITQRYAKVLAEDVKSDFEMVAAKIKK